MKLKTAIVCHPMMGHQLLSEDRQVRVWTIRLAPGERIGVRLTLR
jgi:hypothetical protein